MAVEADEYYDVLIVGGDWKGGGSSLKMSEADRPKSS